MSARIKNTVRLGLLPFALLLGATPSRIPIPGPLPVCHSGEFLTVKDGVLKCRSLLGRLISAPTPCKSGELAIDTSADGLTWGCAPAATLNVVKIAELPDRLARAATDLQTVQRAMTSPVMKQGLLVGTTATKTTGLIVHAGSEPGLLSATAICNDEYPGSHFCSGYELNASVVANLISASKSLARCWVYHPSWKTPIGPAQSPEAGLADSCASYTYDRDDRGWSGIAAEFDRTNLNSENKALAFTGGSRAPCSGSLPLACCK